MHLVHDGRLGIYEVPKAARCPKCRAKVSQANAEQHMTMQPAMTCPKCAHRWIIPVEHPTMCQHLRAPNDTNGNPRRCFALYGDDGKLLDVVDEGYKGQPLHARGLVQLPSVEISASEYREWIKAGEIATGYREEA